MEPYAVPKVFSEKAARRSLAHHAGARAKQGTRMLQASPEERERPLIALSAMVGRRAGGFQMLLDPSVGGPRAFRTRGAGRAADSTSAFSLPGSAD